MTGPAAVRTLAAGLAVADRRAELRRLVAPVAALPLALMKQVMLDQPLDMRQQPERADGRQHVPVEGVLEVALHVAEQHQLLGAMDTWVLQTTLEQVAAWAAQGLWPDEWTISVNQTVSDIQQSHWLSQLESMLRMPHLQARWLDIELTEAVCWPFTKDARSL